MPALLEGPRSGREPIPGVDRALYEGWWGGILAARGRVRIVPPSLTFATELRLSGRRRTAQILSYGGGHTPSDAFLWLRDDRVLAAGDLVSHGFHPWTTDGSPEASPGGKGSSVTR